MVSFKSTKNYLHNLLTDSDGEFSHKPLLIVGASGKGKSIFAERAIERMEDNIRNLITIFFIDETDSVEAGYCMLPATDQFHIQRLEYQKEYPEAKKNVRLWCFYGRELLNWQKKYRKLPKMNIITLGAKSILKKEQCLFLMNTPLDNKAVNLLVKIGDSLKNNEDLKYAEIYGRELTSREKMSYMGKQIETGKEPIADRTDLKDALASLEMFKHDGLIMPEDYPTNFSAKKIISMPNTRHIFIYRCLNSDDEKLRRFVFFHILNEINDAMTDCKYPVVMDIEEAQDIAGFREDEGYKAVMSNKLGKIIGTVRKKGAGTSIIMLSRSWNKISPKIRGECAKQIIFHIERDDMLKYVKTAKLGVYAKRNIENLEKGEYVVAGYENRVCICKMPRHGHKHTYMNFVKEYGKHYPEQLTTYNDIVSEIDKKHQELEKNVAQIVKEQIEEEKRIIRKKEMSKVKEEKSKEIVEQYKQEERKQKDEQNAQRDKAILDEWAMLGLTGKKRSYRIVADNLSQKGIKVSYGTVKNVLSSQPNPTRGNEEPVKTE